MSGPWRGACRRLLRGLLGIALRGQEPASTGSSLLIVANRVSSVDALALALALPRRLWFLPPVQGYCRWPLRRLPVQATSAGQPGLPPCQPEAGGWVVVFPEAQTTADGWPGSVSPVAALLASQTGGEVLPVWIERGGHWPWLRLTLLPVRRWASSPCSGEADTRDQARRQLETWLREMVCAGLPVELTLEAALRRAARQHGARRVILQHPRLGALSYRRLFREVTGWCRRLAGQPEQQVGLLLGDGGTGLILILALQRLGRVPVLLDPRLDAQSLLACCRTVRLGLVYTRRSQVRLVQQLAQLEAGFRVVFLEDLETTPGASAAERARVGHGDPALVLFSRPAGEPHRALRFSHRNLLVGVAQLRAMLTPVGAATVLCLLPNTHPLGLLAGRLLPLLHGMCSADGAPGLTAEQLPGAVSASRARFLITTGNALEPCYRAALPGQLASLRQVWIPAATLTRESRGRWLERVGGRVLEFHVPATLAAVVAVDLPHAYRPPGESHPLPGLVYRLESAPEDRRGQLLRVRADHLAGALATADQPGLWRGVDPGGWWYTGDLLSITAEGSWRFRGRLTRHARVGNEWVSLATLEQLLYHHWPGERHLVLELEAQGETALTVLTTCQQLGHPALGRLLQAEGLSERWLPARVIVVGDWPLAASGESNQLMLRRLAETLIGGEPHTLH